MNVRNPGKMPGFLRPLATSSILSPILLTRLHVFWER